MLSVAARPVRLSAAIMGHPSRDRYVRQLAEQVSGLRPEISYLGPDAGDTSLLGAAAAAWRRRTSTATHHLVLQDDVMAFPDLAARLEAVITVNPSAAVSLFCEWGSKSSYAVRIAAMTGYGAAEVVDRYVPCNGLALPAGTAAVVADRLAWHRDRQPAADDTIIRMVLDELRVPCLVVLPNLVEDRGLESLAGNTEMGVRRSACPPLARWQPPATVLDGLLALPFFQWRTGRTLLLHRTDRAAPWQRTALAPVLGAHGVDRQRIGALAELAAGGVHPDVLAPIRRWLPGLVEVLVATVLCAASLARPGSLRPGSDIARSSIRTLLPGALRCLVPETVAAVGVADWAEPIVERVLELCEVGRLSAINRLEPAC